jgi:hypothetical protein
LRAQRGQRAQRRQREFSMTGADGVSPGRAQRALREGAVRNGLFSQRILTHAR